MMFNNSVDKTKIKYLLRKDEMDRNFKWTKERTAKLCKLNSALTRMQQQLIEQIKHVYEALSRFEKDGMKFLHGYKISGFYGFEKEILNTEASKEDYKFWYEISYYASDELDMWQLIFDSVTEDFLPFSKVRINQTFDSMYYSDDDDETDFKICSYLNHFLEYNRVFSYEDLLNCTEKDFYPYVEVTLNYPLSEFRSQHMYSLRDDMIADMLEKRSFATDDFDWNEDNIQKIMDVNTWVWKKTDDLKRYLTSLSKAFQELAKKDSFFENWNLDGDIEYQGSCATDIASLEMQRLLSDRAAFDHYMLRCNAENPEVEDHIHDSDEKLNWNFGVFKDHFTQEQQKVLFHYLMHVVFIDDRIYSLNDVVRMREDDFKVCLSIDF